MTVIHQIDLTKQSLTAMSDVERKLLLLLGHASNEINVFQKLILISSQRVYAEKLVDHVQAGQTLILMRTLIGKLCEAWDLFKVRFLSEPQVTQLYLPKLNAEARTALKSLKKHFGTRSELMLIRSRFSFHYRDDDDLVEQSFQQIPADEPWHFYLSNIEGNCFYYASELVVQSAVIKLADQAPNDMEPFLDATARSFEALCDRTISVSRQTQVLFGECIKEIIGHSLPDTESVGTLELSALPALSDLRIPFFVDDTEFKPRGPYEDS